MLNMRLSNGLIMPIQHCIGQKNLFPVYLSSNFSKFSYEAFFGELSNLSQKNRQNDESKLYQQCDKVIKEINKYVNEMRDAGAIEKYPGDITKQVWL